MKKTLGYGFKFAGETFEQSLAIYAREGGFHKNKTSLKTELAEAKLRRDIPKRARPKVFKVTVEVE